MSSGSWVEEEAAQQQKGSHSPDSQKEESSHD